MNGPKVGDQFTLRINWKMDPHFRTKISGKFRNSGKRKVSRTPLVRNIEMWRLDTNFSAFKSTFLGIKSPFRSFFGKLKNQITVKKNTNFRNFDQNQKSKNIELFQNYIGRDVCFYFSHLSHFFWDLYFFYSWGNFFTHPVFGPSQWEKLSGISGKLIRPAWSDVFLNLYS